MKTVRDLRHLRPLGVRRVGLTRKYTGSWLKTSGLGSVKERSITTSKARREDSFGSIEITKCLRCVDRGLKAAKISRVASLQQRQVANDRSLKCLKALFDLHLLADMLPCLSSQGIKSLRSCSYKRKLQKAILLLT